MGLTISESEFYEKFKSGKVRGYVAYDGTFDDEINKKTSDTNENPVLMNTFIVYNTTLTPSEGGEKAIYRECETESEAIAITRMLNTIFESFVTVEFDMDEEDMQDETIEETMTYEHVLVQWAYA